MLRWYTSSMEHFFIMDRVVSKDSFFEVNKILSKNFEIDFLCLRAGTYNKACFCFAMVYYTEGQRYRQGRKQSFLRNREILGKFRSLHIIHQTNARTMCTIFLVYTHLTAVTSMTSSFTVILFLCILNEYTKRVSTRF